LNTRKLAGKTLTRQLDPEQAQTYRDWIANRRLDDLLAEMDELSRQAAELLITPAPSAHRPSGT
jgi:RNA-binding protein YlmH